MGQGQSQPKREPKPILLNREPTPEPLDPEEAARFREERARLQAEDRARRAAAAEQRFANKQGKKPTAAGNASSSANAVPKKKETPLEQMSRENKGWRDADEQADLRAWN